MNNYKELAIWKRSIKLATSIYKITGSFPSEEKFGLVSQMRRSAVSIPSNIAEGAGRKSNKEFSQFLSISYGSLCELETQVIISNELEFLISSEVDQIILEIDEIQKMTYALINKFSS
ncbi:four helix bundle protein [Aquiflexum sp. LQ15W]|uniref:four helix bundle protein n=1 Tax=Cognataquiflexum nitidum TaxID=2922272 RepID=UPI001F1487BD|nr:four helix bundle protein [Cognataquiflexum nitidum]MCH6199154.1 four helix bundle protein [Cognataquiflexum nitidum]